MRGHQDSLRHNAIKRIGRRGQTTMEYVILLAIVVMIAVQLKRTIVPLIKTLVTKVESNITQIDE